MKTTIFDAACCEGCGLQVGNHGERSRFRSEPRRPSLREVVKEQSDRHNNSINKIQYAPRRETSIFTIGKCCEMTRSSVL